MKRIITAAAAMLVGIGIRAIAPGAPTTRPSPTSKPAAQLAAPAIRKGMALWAAEKKLGMKAVKNGRGYTFTVGDNIYTVAVDAHKIITGVGMQAKPPPPPPQLKLEVGSIGAARQVHVQQVVDTENMLATFFYEVQTLHGNRPGDTIWTPELKESPTVWIQMPTAGLTNGVVMKQIDQVFEVTGTKTYDTRAGSNTVFVLKPHADPATQPAK